MLAFREILTVVIAALAAAAISYVLTPLVKHFSLRFGFVDIPKDERRMHHQPIPTIGGLAIFSAFFLVVLVTSNLSRQLIGHAGRQHDHRAFGRGGRQIRPERKV